MCILCKTEKDRTKIGRGLSVLYREVSPSQAALIIGDHNKSNRKIKQNQVERLASDITDGRWRPDMPDFCGFDTSMHIISAQHRLTAIIAAGKPAGMWFVFGLPQDSRSVTDQAVTWSMSDTMHRNGVEMYASAVASTLKMVAVWRMGRLTNAAVRPARINMSKSKLEAEMANHPDLAESVKWAYRHRLDVQYMTVTTLAFGHYVLTRYASKVYGQEFWDGCLDRNTLKRDDPRMAMLKMFERLHKEQVGERVIGIYVYGVIKAWNFWVEEKTLKSMSYKQVSTSGDGFVTEKWADIPQLVEVDG